MVYGLGKPTICLSKIQHIHLLLPQCEPVTNENNDPHRYLIKILGVLKLT